jgi:hypothetical protein
MKPAWLENWSVAGNAAVVDEAGGYVLDDMRDDGPALALAAAAPALVRALLRVEWTFDDEDMSFFCPDCEQSRGEPHRPDCTLDAALTAAGFPDQGSREAARERMDVDEVEAVGRKK